MKGNGDLGGRDRDRDRFRDRFRIRDRFVTGGWDVWPYVPSAPLERLFKKGCNPLPDLMLKGSETESNCGVATHGGEQLKVNFRPVTQVNSIRLDSSTSPLGMGEVVTTMNAFNVAAGDGGFSDQPIVRKSWVVGDRTEIEEQATQRGRAFTRRDG